MPTIVWLGPVVDARQVEPVLAGLGLDVAPAPNIDSAIALAASRHAVAVVVAVDWSDLPVTVKRLSAILPAVQVLFATRLGVPPQVSAAFDAGVDDLLDLKELDAAQIGAAIERAVSRHQRANRERELFLKLHALNEDFLRSMVIMDKRNLELEELLRGDPADENGPVRILIVDDEPALCGLMEMLLTERGYEVTTAADAEAALRAFVKSPFQLLITDKNLPGRDGIALMCDVKRQRPETDVIVITAYASKESAITALNTGAAAYLEKPFDDIEDLGRKVDEVVHGRRQRQRKREFLQQFKERNHDFLEQYKTIRAELEAWLGGG
jgi:DNA-binding NtrC family response regulator